MLRDDWCFGPRTVFDAEEGAFFDRHQPVVRAWIEEGLASGAISRTDEAEHAAFALVEYRVFEWEEQGGAAPRWAGFDVERFFWDHLPCGGTVELYEPRRFFHRMVEIAERFGEAGLIDDPDWREWLTRMRTLEEDFVRFYGETPAEEQLRRFMAPRAEERAVDRPSAPPLPTRSKPTPAAHRKQRAKRKAQRAARRRGR
jgi:hypothetical protein